MSNIISIGLGICFIVPLAVYAVFKLATYGVLKGIESYKKNKEKQNG